MDEISEYDSRLIRLVEWYRDWLLERCMYPIKFELNIDWPLKVNDEVCIKKIPTLEMTDDEIKNEITRTFIGYSISCYFIKEKLTNDTRNKLATAIGIIKKLYGLDVEESFAYMIFLRIMLYDYRQSKEKEVSILLQPTNRMLMEIPKDKYHELIELFHSKALFSLNEVIDFWNSCGFRLSSGVQILLNAMVSSNEFKITYRKIPPYIKSDRILINKIKTKLLIDIQASINNDEKVQLEFSMKDFTNLFNNKPSKNCKIYRHFPYIPSLKWSEVTIEFVSDDAIKIKARKISEKYTYSEIGFKDKRKGDLPNSRWDFLRDDVTKYMDGITWKSSINPKIKKNLNGVIRDLRKILIEIVGIEEDPFYRYKINQSYKPKFKIFDKRYGG